MTNAEFSNSFDALVNFYTQNVNEWLTVSQPKVFSFNEYEKSLFLTQAQEQIIIEYYTGKNPFNEAFEKTEEIRRYLSSLVKTDVITNRVSTNTPTLLSDKSYCYKLPTDEKGKSKVWFITYEAVKLSENLANICMRGQVLAVVPIRQDEYHRTKKNPFRGPNRRRALRLDLEDNQVEIISNFDIDSYMVRYLSRPRPIILVDLTDMNLTINGEKEVSQCELNPLIHHEILERAVRLGLTSKSPITNNKE